jgi:Zn-dependent protease
MFLILLFLEEGQYMLRTRSLGKIFGVDVKVHGTFLLLLAFVAISGLLKGGMFQALLSLALSVIIFSVVVMHEFGHILAARRYGVRTKDVILSPLGGVARLLGMPKDPNAEIAIAAAGPAVNLLLAGVGSLLLQISVMAHPTTMAMAFASALVGWFVTVNLVLLGFNLIPAIPMDGGRILRALLSKKQGHMKATQTAAKVARWSALAMAVYAIYAGHFMLLLIAGFVFVMSWVEVMQANVRQAQQNPLMHLFRGAQQAQGQPQGGYGQVVDQNGNPVQDNGGWRVTGARWADRP